MFKTQVIGRNVVIETKDAEEGKIVTTVVNRATDVLMDSKMSTNEQDALKDHDDMITTYALPLQARLHAAHMEQGKRYTIVMLKEFGLPVAVNFTYEAEDYAAYAQYEDAATVYCIPKGARKLRKFRLYNQSFAVYDGWRVLADDMIFNVDRRPGCITAKVGKYDCADERYIADILDVWADYIVAYKKPSPKPEPLPVPDPKPAFQPREVSAGIMLMCDEEHGVYVDMAPETFEELYGPQLKAITAEENLIRALRRATVASMGHAMDNDGGTCNFDSPTLDYKAFGITRDAAERSVKAAGMSCYDWEGQLVLSGHFYGQGNRRTTMAETFCRSLTGEGIPAGMYYQMD